jgi:hypothetical protein
VLMWLCKVRPTDYTINTHCRAINYQD